MINNQSQEIQYEESSFRRQIISEIHDSCGLQKLSLCRNITELDLSNNSLVELPSNVSSLINLRFLDLSKNKLSTLPLFLRNLTQLLSLNAAYNDFNDVPEVLYYSLRNLRFLDLSFNKISNFNHAPHCLINILDFRITNNNLVQFPMWIFSTLCSLQILELSNNPICNHTSTAVISRNCFYSSGIFESLKVLKVENCNLLTNKHEFMSHMKNLKSLNIGNSYQLSRYRNCFANINTEYLKHCPDLECLSMHNLQISLLPSDFYDSFKCLSYLNLSDNGLSWLPESFNNLKSLKVINLNSNQLLFLPSLIGNLENLKQIHLSYNQLCKLPETFIKLSNLEVLDLYSNNLEMFEFSILNCGSLKGIDLEKNFLNAALMDFHEDDKHSITKRYGSLKKWLRNQFGHENSRSDGQQTKELEYKDPVRNILHYGENYISEIDFVGCAENDITYVENIPSYEGITHVDINNGIEESWDTQPFSSEEHDHFDPNLVRKWNKGSPFKEKEPIHFCPGWNHLPSVVSIRNNQPFEVEEGQFDSE